MAYREGVPLLLDSTMGDFTTFDTFWRERNQSVADYSFVGPESKASHVAARSAVLEAFGLSPVNPEAYRSQGYKQGLIVSADELRGRVQEEATGARAFLTIGEQNHEGHSIHYLEKFIERSYGSLTGLFDARTSAALARVGMAIPHEKMPAAFREGKYVAVHYRAGEIINVTGLGGVGNRFVLSREYGPVLAAVRKAHPGLPIHVFTSMLPPAEVDDLAAFEGCTIHGASDVGTLTTWAIFVRAEALVTAKSSFSYVAAILRGSKPGTYYRPFWHAPLGHWKAWSDRGVETIDENTPWGAGT